MQRPESEQKMLYELGRRFATDMSKDKPRKQSKRERRNAKMTDVLNKAVILEHIQTETGIKGDWDILEMPCPRCQIDDYTYLFEDNKTCYCVACGKEFDVMESVEAWSAPDDRPNSYLSDEYAKANTEASKQVGTGNTTDIKTYKDHTKGQGSSQSAITTPNTSGTWEGWKPTTKVCTHRPQHVIAGDGWGVWAGKRLDVRYNAADFDLVINLTYSSVKQTHVIPIPELQTWEDHHASFTEMLLDWPDFGVVTLPRKFWEQLIAHVIENKMRVLVFCEGGHGRTGTAVACMMVVALDMKPDKAMEWIRKNYCFEAIESLAQEQYIRRVAATEEVKDDAATVAITRGAWDDD
jgi:protein-tyrosine phosphatase